MTFGLERQMRARHLWALLTLLIGALTTIQTATACTIFTLALNGHVLMGNNEDFIKRGAVWFVPGENGRLGRVNFGFHDEFGKIDYFAQGSMNERGLAFDAATAPKVPWVKDPEKLTSKNVVEEIMNHCSTIDEVVKQFQNYNCHYLAECQFMFADRSGESVVIAWLPKKGLSITRQKGGIQVVTNTRLNESSYRCQRWVRAEKELSMQLPRDKSLSEIEIARRALSSVHQHGPHAFTSYSCIYDLKQQKIHVCNLTNYDETVTFDLAAEVAKGPTSYLLRNVFKDSPNLKVIKAKPQRVHYGTRVSLDSKMLERFEGLYELEKNSTLQFRVEATERGLRVHSPGRPPTDLFPESDSVFRMEPDRGQLTFHVTTAGTVSGMTLNKRFDVKLKRVQN